MRLVSRLGVSAAFGVALVALIKPLQLVGLGVAGISEGELGWWSLVQVVGWILSLIITMPTILCMVILPSQLMGEANTSFFAVSFCIWAGVAYLWLDGKERRKVDC